MWFRAQFCLLNFVFGDQNLNLVVKRDHQRNWRWRSEILDNWIEAMANFLLRPQSSSHLHGYQSLIFKWYANGRVIGISGYALAGSFHVYEEVSCTLLSCIQALFTKKDHVIRRILKIPNARVSRFVDWCTVMTLESFSCVFCQSKEFDRVTDWLKHSLQAIMVYMSSIFLCSKMIIKDLATV